MLGLYFNMYDTVLLVDYNAAASVTPGHENPAELFKGTPAQCAAYIQQYAAQNGFKLVSAAFIKREEGD